MVSRFEEIEQRYEEVEREMASPTSAGDPTRLRELGRAFAELEEIVRPYRDYRRGVQQAEDARALEKDESDPDMAAFFREEAQAAERRAEELLAALGSLLVPKDPHDGKGVV